MNCKIKLNKQDLRYIAGETLNGTVEINNSENKKVRSICILISGSADVHWTEEESYHENNETKSRTVSYDSHEQYLNSETLLFGSFQNDSIIFPAGFHTYNFACVLPDRLPGNVEGSYGKIKYKVKLIVDIPWGFNITEEIYFSVVNMIDLNHNYSLRIPVQLEEIKSFCLCSCGPNKASITVTIPKSGFAPHDTLHIDCRIDNPTTVNFEKIVFKLIQIVIFRSTSPSHSERRSTATIIEKVKSIFGIPTRECVVAVAEDLTIPVCPVSCDFSSNIQTKYVLSCTFVVVGVHTNADVKIPITIGTIPITSTEITIPQVPVSMPTAPPLESTKNMIEFDNPPTYDEATGSSQADIKIGWKVDQ